MQSLSDKDLPCKCEFLASLHSCIGNAQLELGEGETALRHHMEDLRLAEEWYDHFRVCIGVCREGGTNISYRDTRNLCPTNMHDAQIQATHVQVCYLGFNVQRP